MAKQPLPPRKKFGSNHRPIVTRDVEPAVQSDPWLQRALDAYTTSTTFIETNYKKDWDNSVLHFQSRHMNGSKYNTDAYKYRSKMFRPKTRSTVRNSEAATAAAFFSQLEVITVEPEDDKDPLQLASASLRQELLNYRLTGKKQIPWFQICVGAMQEANVYGIVCSKQFWDYQDKEITVPLPGILNQDGSDAVVKQVVKIKDQPDIKLYPIENIRFDPAAEWTDVVNSSPYFIALEPMRIGDVKQKMQSGEWKNVDTSLLLTARNQAYDSTRQTRAGDTEDATDPKFSKELSDFDIVWVHENFMRIGGSEYQYYTLGTVARLSEPQPLGKAYLHNIRPFVIGTCVLEPHKAAPDSPVHLAKGTQKEANEISNTRLDNVKLVLNKRWLARRGKQVDLQSLVRNAPGSVTLVNDIEKDVFPIEFNDVTSSSYAEQDRINVDFDELLGSFSAGSIATNRKLGETVGGLQMLRGTANSMGQYLIRVFSETWVEKVLNQLDELEQHYESNLELLYTLGRRANIARYGIEAITKDVLMAPARVTVNVANSAMDPTVRLELFTFAMQKYAEFRQMMPPDIDPQPVKEYIFGLLGFRDASRFSVDTDGNPQMAAAQQMIQQLQQALEGKMMEIQAANESKMAAVEQKHAEAMAKIEAENARTAAELSQSERESEREARMQMFLARLQENTKLLIAQMQQDAQAGAAQSSEETKRFAAGLQADTKAMIASMQSKDKAMTVVDSSVKGEFGQMAGAFEAIAKGMAQNSEALTTIAKGLESNAENLAAAVEAMSAPRETEIVERDEEGMPKRSRSKRVIQ
jgi:hypothetical protein